MVVQVNNASIISSREQLAIIFRKNWQALHPMEANSNGNVDDSLRSLDWLQHLNPLISTSVQVYETRNASPNTTVKSIYNNVTMEIKQEPRCYTLSSPPSNIPSSIDYQRNSSVKPSYSYANLITMAIEESKEKRLTLSSIYNWITDNFMYYKNADTTWQVC